MVDKGAEVQDVLKTLSSEQRNGFMKLTARISNTNGLTTATSSSAGKRLENNNSDSSDNDVIILDDSEPEDGGEVELMELSSAASTGSSPKPGSEAEVVFASKRNNLVSTQTYLSDTSTSESEEESEESDHDWEVITIEDDDDTKPRIAPKEMECFRCPNKRVGTFRDEKKYWTHITRHVLPDIFSCVTCQRSFHKLTHCLSHELRVHGTPLGYDVKDKVISTAKAYLKERQGKENKKSETNTQSTNGNDNEIDCEDVMFYGDHFVCSSSIYPYRGPKVNTMLEAYEIQYSYASRRKTPRINNIAKLAIDVHEQNVLKKQDTFKLGRFSNRKNRLKTAVAVKKPSKKAPKTTVHVKGKRSRDVISERESTKEKPKKKRVRYEFISSSSSSDSENSDDLDYKPSEEKPKNTKRGSENAVAGPSGIKQQSKPSRKRQNEEPEEPSKKRMCFTALLKRVCQLCNYAWETEQDMRIHRDTSHPNIPLRDLMAVPIPVKKQKSSTKLKVAESEKKLEAKKGAKHAKKIATGKRKSKQLNSATGANEPPVNNRVARKRRSRNVDRRPEVPLPDQTFSPKEVFLHSLGLTNCVRLHLHQKKTLADLNIPLCYVTLNRLTDWEISVCMSRGASSLLMDYLPSSHFLLG